MYRTRNTGWIWLTGMLLIACVALQRYSTPTATHSLDAQRWIQRSAPIVRALGIDADAATTECERNADTVAVRFSNAAGEPRAWLAWDRRTQQLLHLDNVPGVGGRDPLPFPNAGRARQHALYWLIKLGLIPASTGAGALTPGHHTTEHWDFQTTVHGALARITLHRQTGEPILVHISARQKQ